ncbi:MAG: 4'-phosphopantetheinyl transferase superfamily protein [Elusimicrobiaceae bacterium]|nr:4'-phosphopantetheinyl transferase superfamily protein [Elusimicrobiaceae bacterium]
MAYQLEVVDLHSLPPAGTVLGERETAFYHTLKLPKRQTEWFGGRLALKRLLTKHRGCQLQEIEILAPGGQGKPVVTVGENPINIPFSITHSQGFAVAAIAPNSKYVGIDLEKIEHRISAWKEDFFRPDELTDDTDSFLTMLWTQKEALVKMLGTGLTVNSREVRIVDGVPQFSGRALEMYNSLGSPQITLETKPLLKDFQFSIALGK